MVTYEVVAAVMAAVRIERKSKIMDAVEIKKGIYWAGAVDWNVRNFHGHTYTTTRGTTYNSYLIVDEKIALIDGVRAEFAGELMERVRSVVDPAKIDYIVVNHVEPDHSGARPEIMKLCRNAKLVGTAKCKDGLYKYYYGAWDFQVVKTGGQLSLGSRSLSFVEAPMIHWPDSMFTYCPEERMLMPNDAFGQHYASVERFSDEVDQCGLWYEAKKYYANILWPLGPMISRKIDEVSRMNLPIDVIAPSHGLIWRADPMRIVQQYLSWAKQEPVKKAVIVYETMWGSTAKMAALIAEGFISAGVSVKIYDITQSDKSEVVTDMLDAKGFLFGSSTHDNDMLPTIAGFMELVKGFKPKNRVTGVFGSFGWGGGAVKELEDVLKESGIAPGVPPLQVKFAPDVDETKAGFNFGRDFAAKV